MPPAYIKQIAPVKAAASQSAELVVQYDSWISTLEVFHGDRAERGNSDDGISEEERFRKFLGRGKVPHSL